MKLISICLLVANLLLVTAYGGSKEQLPEFSDVRYEKESFVFTTHASGWNLIGKLGKDGDDAKLRADSDVKVPIGEESYFVASRNRSLVLTPLDGKKGFNVKRLTDLRSFRRGLKEESFSIAIDRNGGLVYGEVSTKMTYAGKGAEDKEDLARALAVKEPEEGKKSSDGIHGTAVRNSEFPQQSVQQGEPKSEKNNGGRPEPAPEWWWAMGPAVLAIVALLWRIRKKNEK